MGSSIIGSLHSGDRLRVVDDEVMAVVGGDDQGGVVPVAVLLDPVDDRLDRLLAAVDGPDGVVQVVVVEREVDVAGLDEQGEGLAGLRPRGRSSAARVMSTRVGCSLRSSGVYDSALPSRSGAGSKRPSAVRYGRWLRVFVPKKPKSRWPFPAAVEAARPEASPPSTPGRGLDHDVLAAVPDVDRRLVGVGEVEVARHGVLALRS